MISILYFHLKDEVAENVNLLLIKQSSSIALVIYQVYINFTNATYKIYLGLFYQLTSFVFKYIFNPLFPTSKTVQIELI